MIMSLENNLVVMYIYSMCMSGVSLMLCFISSSMTLFLSRIFVSGVVNSYARKRRNIGMVENVM